MTAEVMREERTASGEGRLAELYRRFAPGAVRLAYLLTGDAGLAEDLTHDAFVRVGGRLFAIRDPEAFSAYLRRTVVNLATSHWRRVRLERALVRRGVSAAPDSPGIEVRDELWQALQRLSARQRAAIVLRYYADLSELATADLLGCRPGTVKSLVSRGLEALREMVTR